MSLAIIGFNFKNSTYLVFNKDTKTAKLMTLAELLGKDITEAKYENGVLKPIYPESRYFQEELYSDKIALLQGYVIEPIDENTFSVFTNQSKVISMSTEQLSKLYTVLNAEFRFPNGVPKITINNMQAVLSNNVDEETTELIGIFRKDIQGYNVVSENGWPSLYSHKPAKILKALKAWINLDYPNLIGYYSYFIKFPILYSVKGKTPLLKRKSYIYAIYSLLRAKIIWDTAIQDIKDDKEVPTLPLLIRPYSLNLKWEIALLEKMPKDQSIQLRYLVDQNSIARNSQNASIKVSNANALLSLKGLRSRLLYNYTSYNTELYNRYTKLIEKLKTKGYTMYTKQLSPEEKLISLINLNPPVVTNDYKDYCFIKMKDYYIKLTRPRRAEYKDSIVPKVEVVKVPESGVKTYDLGPVEFIGVTETEQIMEMLIHYANRAHKHYEYILNQHSINIYKISKKASFYWPTLNDLSDVNKVLEYMYA